MIRIFEIQFGKPIFISVAQNPRALVRYGIRKIHADSRFQYGTKLMMLHTVALTRSIKQPTKRQIVKSCNICYCVGIFSCLNVNQFYSQMPKQ